MADPDDLLGAEAAGQPVPGVPTAPGEIPLPAGEEPSAFTQFLGRCWKKLTTPTTKTPQDYSGRLLGAIVNRGLDRGATGHAHEVMMGERVDLVVDHLMAGESQGGRTPLGILASGVYEYSSAKVQDALKGAPA